MLHAHVQSFLTTLALMCLLDNFLDVELRKTSFKFINAEMTQKSASETSAQKIELIFNLTLYVTCVVFLHSGLSPLSLNPSISIKVYETVVIPNALYGSEIWSSMTPADLRKLEHSHRFCLKHMQGLPRRTPTNFTLSPFNAIPMETVIDHKKMNFRGQLCNLSWSYLLNVSSSSGSHISNTWTTRALFSSLILTEYWPSMLYTMYLIDIYQMECFTLGVHMKRIIYVITIQRSKRVTPPPPLRTAYRPILALRTAYRHFSVSRTAYRLTTKTTIFGVSIYMKKIKWQSVACTCILILSNVSFHVFARYIP